MEGFHAIHEANIEKFYTGASWKSYAFFGAHPVENGTHFAVFAPHAESVAVVGSFRFNQNSFFAMQNQKGIWHAFVPDACAGDRYQYQIVSGGKTFLKSDPYAFYSALRPETYSVIHAFSDFSWTDEGYFEQKTKISLHKSPINIYEVHLGSFKQKPDGGFLNYRELAPLLISYALQMGYNYIELMPLCEHPLDESWGYQTTGYYSLTSRYGTPEDFKYFVNELHNAGIGVLLDWVPGHFCKDDHGLFRFDGAPLFESENSTKADNPGWGTCNFDFSKKHVQSFLKSNADFWLSEYHIDGFRVDAVANMLTFDFGKMRCDGLKNQYDGYENIEAICFLRELNAYVRDSYPGRMMCAEDSSDRSGITQPTEIGGLGFTFKWNLGWMHDSLSYMQQQPELRKEAHNRITFPMVYAFNEKFILPLSHDESVHGKGSMRNKMAGGAHVQMAQLKAYYAYMYTLPGKKLMFMGNEFGQGLEWRFYEGLEWQLTAKPENAGLQSFVADLNSLYLHDPALYEQDNGWEGFCWSVADDRENNVFAYARYGKNKQDALVAVFNFSGERKEGHTIGVPYFIEYREILNSDNALYGGQNFLNRGLIVPKPGETGDMPYSAKINLPPFSAVLLKPCYPGKG